MTKVINVIAYLDPLSESAIHNYQVFAIDRNRIRMNQQDSTPVGLIGPDIVGGFHLEVTASNGDKEVYSIVVQ